MHLLPPHTHTLAHTHLLIHTRIHTHTHLQGPIMNLMPPSSYGMESNGLPIAGNANGNAIRNANGGWMGDATALPVHTHTHTHTQTHAHTHTTHTQTHTHTRCQCVFERACAHAYVIGAYLCYGCVCASKCKQVQACAHAHAWKFSVYIQFGASVCVHACTHAWVLSACREFGTCVSVHSVHVRVCVCACLLK